MPPHPAKVGSAISTLLLPFDISADQEGESLSDWGAIEAHVRDQDAIMIRDLNEDINTFLVFVSYLFSNSHSFLST